MPIYAATSQSTATVTPTNASSISVGTVATIIVGCLLAGVLFIVLALYFFHCSARHRFARVAKHADADVYGAPGAPILRELPSLSRWGTKYFTPHSKRYSMSKESLSPASWPQIPSKSRVLLHDSPVHLNTPLPHNTDHPPPSFEVSENARMIPSETAVVPVQQSLGTSRPDLGHSLPHAEQTLGVDAVSGSTLATSRQDDLVPQMIRSRAQALEGVAPAHHSSLDTSRSYSPTLDSPVARADLERLLAEVERNALRDVEKAQWSDEEEEEEEEEDWGDTASVYSQASATFDHSVFFSVSRHGSLTSLPRRKSSRKKPRGPVPADLPPVPELPDHLRAREAQPGSLVASTTGAMPVEGQHPQGAASQPLSSVADGLDTASVITSETSVSSVSWAKGASRHPLPRPRSDSVTPTGFFPPNVPDRSAVMSGRPDASLARHLAVPVPAKQAYPREETANFMPETRRKDGGRGGYTTVAL